MIELKIINLQVSLMLSIGQNLFNKLKLFCKNFINLLVNRFMPINKKLSRKLEFNREIEN